VRAQAKIATYGLVLAASLAGGFALGELVGPLDDDPPRAETCHDHEGPPSAQGCEAP
jgi:hypothetical protein